MTIKRSKTAVSYQRLANTTAGQELRAFRKLQGYTQRELAHLAETSQARISDLERGTVGLGPKLALRLATILNIHPGLLLFPNGWAPEPDRLDTNTRLLKELRGPRAGMRRIPEVVR